MNKNISLIIITLFIFLVSCEKTVLNKEPLNEFSELIVWTDVNLASNYLNSVYDGIGQWGSHHYRNPQVMANSATDEAWQRGDHGVWILNRGDISASSFGDFNMWKPDYQAINRCNIFLENIDQVENAEPNDIQVMKAEARFVRAINYADLLNWYSQWEGDENGVPLITKTFKLDDVFSMKRSNYSEVLDFILSELDDIKSILPDKWDGQNFGRVTKGSALALKSEVLLYAAGLIHNPTSDLSKWTLAANAAKELIDLNLYSLKTVSSWNDYADIFLKASNNPEIILARPYDPVNLPGNWVDLYNSPNGYGGWGGNCPTQQLVDKFQMENGKDISDPASGYNPQDPYVGRELRFYADITYNGRIYHGRQVETFLPGGLDSQEGPTGWNTSLTGYTLYKFMDESVDFTKSPAPTPWVIFRLAEIYLNYAEAEYHIGNEDVAREYLNKIRTRAQLPESESTGEQLLRDIMHERSIELAFEKDIRWNDVRRWKILEQTASQDYMGMKITKSSSGQLTYEKVVAMKRGYNERMYSLPIPLGEIQKDGGLKQNPGY